MDEQVDEVVVRRWTEADIGQRRALVEGYRRLLEAITLEDAQDQPDDDSRRPES